jgi:hypothetical protein
MIICWMLLCMFHKFKSLTVITMYRTAYPELYDSEHSLNVVNSRMIQEYKFSLIHTNQNYASGKL